MASTIRRAGTDLLTLINDILDLSKIESGTTSIDIAEQRITDLCDDVERTFRGVAQERGLAFRDLGRRRTCRRRSRPTTRA